VHIWVTPYICNPIGRVQDWERAVEGISDAARTAFCSELEFGLPCPLKSKDDCPKWSALQVPIPFHMLRRNVLLWSNLYVFLRLTQFHNERLQTERGKAPGQNLSTPSVTKVVVVTKSGMEQKDLRSSRWCRESWFREGTGNGVWKYSGTSLKGLSELRTQYKKPSY